MTLGATAANVAWLAGGAGAMARFRDALGTPAESQRAWLRSRLVRHARTEFGETHGFASITTERQFARQVPPATYDDLAPFIERMRRGEPRVLTADRMTHLAPTSGSTGGRKLIPFTAALARAFDAAVAPWLADLVRQRPRLVLGPAYWSVSPLAPADLEERGRRGTSSSEPPVGFADDAEYLGGVATFLVRRLLAVPSSARLVADEAAFWRLSLLALVRTRELRLISVWHPSFLELLVAAAGEAWPELLDAVERGTNPWAGALPFGARVEWRARPDRRRASELRGIGPSDWPAWWPHLEVVSCWGDAAAEPGWRTLTARLPRVLVQRKGLLATEAVITVPIAGEFPLAVTSHYFEFLDDAGEIRGAADLERGGRYEVIVTNGAGLWRYRLGDIVECTGHLLATPCLRFLGRAGSVSDLRGEKLSEAFVAEALRRIWSGAPPDLAFLRAWERGPEAGYELVVSADAAARSAEIAELLERVLRENPHYEIARRLGQLAPLRVVTTDAGAAADLREQALARSARLGDVKPRALVAAPAGEHSY